MKKLLTVFVTLSLVLVLVGCEEPKPSDEHLVCTEPQVLNETGDQCIDIEEGTIEVIDFTGMMFTDVLSWASDNKVKITPSSEYRDDLLKNEVFYQDLQPGTKINEWDEIIVHYSRGLNPDGEVSLPDFSGKTLEEVQQWFKDNDISKAYYYETFTPSIEAGEFVKVVVERVNEDRTENVRRDVYKIYFSRGDLEVEEVQFDEIGTVRGVNLGGWFVLESWMTPELFDGINDAHDETTWIINNPNAEEDLIEHWETFITEEDFQWLSDHGIDYIRLPIPWWMWGDHAYAETRYEDNTLPWWDGSKHVYKDYEVQYIASVDYINQAMEWAEEYNLKVLVDLHTAPGGQNGFDNGGLSGVNVWANEEYVTMTLLKIRDMVQHFNQFDSFWGFELLNEPSWGVNLNILQEFYVDAYNIIRAYNQDIWIGMHDGFRMYMETEWKEFFIDNAFDKVFFDIHLYQVFGDMWGEMSIYEHLEWVHVEQGKAVHRYDGIVPVIVGEWSGGLPVALYEDLDPEMHDTLKEAFLSAQLNVYEEGMGHFFWSYQILQGTHMEWDIVRLMEAGLIPTDWSPEEEAN